MIKVPYEEVRQKLKDSAGITDEQLDERIRAKIDKLSGLISKEGAAHIIANEMGVKLFDKSSGRLKIKNILAGMRNVELVGKVQQVFEVREFQTETRSGKVGSFIVGDETGTIRVVMWGSQADRLNELSKDITIKIESAYVKENRGRKEVHLGDHGQLELQPEGEEVGEVKRTTSTRKSVKELDENMQDVELLGTIVQAYDIKFFETCPECGKKAMPKDGSTVCSQHGNVTPAPSYVFNVILDDGTGNIRTTFFRKQVENLLKMEGNELVQFRESPEKFEQVKHDLLGKQIKVVGRVNKNPMFDRIEFIAQLVFPDPDPEEEKKRLESVKQEKQTAAEAPQQEAAEKGAQAGEEEAAGEDTGAVEQEETSSHDKTETVVSSSDVDFIK